MGWVEQHFIKHRINLNAIFRTLNGLGSLQLLVIQLEHPVSGKEH